MNRRFFLASGALFLLAAKKKKGAATSANNVFAPFEGSSASRLPPVRAATLPANWRHFDITLTLKAEISRKEPREALIKSASEMKREAHGAQQARHINEIGELVSTAQRSDSFAQSLNQRFPTTLRFPLPLHQDTPTQPWQRIERLSWESEARVFLERQPDDGMETLVCEWATANKPSQLLLSTSLAVADRRFDVSRRTFAPEREDVLRKNLTATSLLPVNDTARELAKSIVGRIVDPLAQAHALYDWVVEKSVFDTTLPDSDGNGDIRQQIESGQYGGGAADISGLFVLLARAIGIPARRVFGFFIAPSELSSALGTTADESELATLLHCRAEFYTPGYHWIAVDPAAVCRVAALDSDIADSENTLTALKRITFGFWEMNWLALNYAENETLGNLPSFSPEIAHTCQLASREIKRQESEIRDQESAAM